MHINRIQQEIVALRRFLIEQKKSKNERTTARRGNLFKYAFLDAVIHNDVRYECLCFERLCIYDVVIF